jgi:tape measure domain-containing protein
VAESLGAAVLTVSVDDAQLKAGLQVAERQAQASGKKIEQSLTPSSRPGQKAANGLEGYIDAQNRARTASGKLLTVAQQQAAGLDRLGGSASTAAGGVARLTPVLSGLNATLQSLAGVAGVVGIGALTQQLIATGQESQRAQIQLSALAGGYNEAAAAGQAAARIQKVLGISAVDATQGFAQLYAALRGTGIGLQQLEVLFVGISNAARLSGAGTQEAQAALLQLKQGLAAGVLQGDELRSVLEQLPAFAQAIAAQLNANVGQLRQLGSEGKITSDIVFNAAKQLATATVPGRTEIEQLGIAFENVKAQAAAALGPPLLGILQTTAAGLVAFKKFLEENQTALINVGRSVIEIGKTFAPFVAGILAVQAAMKAWSIASKAVAVAQAAVLALQGPKGWAVLAGAVAASATAAAVLENTLKGVGKATQEAKAEAQAAFDQFKQLLNTTTLSNPATELAKAAEATKKWAAEVKVLNELLSIQEATAIEQQRGSLTGTGIGALQAVKALEDARRAERDAQAALRAGQNEDADKRQSLLDASRVASENVKLAAAKTKADLEDAYKSAQDSVKSISRSIEDAVTALSAARGGTEGVNKFINPQDARNRQEAANAQLLADATKVARELGVVASFSGSLTERNAQIAEFINAGRQELRGGQDLMTLQDDFVKATADLATANDALFKVNSALVEATQALATKDWNVYVSVPGGNASGDVVREGVYQ